MVCLAVGSGRGETQTSAQLPESLSPPLLAGPSQRGGPPPWDQPASFPAGFQSRYLDTWVSPASITSSQKGRPPLQPHKSVVKLHLTAPTGLWREAFLWNTGRLGLHCQSSVRHPRTVSPPDCRDWDSATDRGVGRGSTDGPWESPVFTQCLLSPLKTRAHRGKQALVPSSVKRTQTCISINTSDQCAV